MKFSKEQREHHLALVRRILALRSDSTLIDVQKQLERTMDHKFAIGYDTSNGVSSSTGQYADNFWKIGKPYRVENYDNAGNLYKLTITKWDSTSTGGNAAYVFPDQTLEMDYDGLSTHQDSADSYTWNATTGNQTQQIQWGQVTGSSTGAFATSSLGYTTNYSYASSTGSNVIGKVSDETLLNQSSTKIQETQYYYDGLAQGSIGAGNLTTQDDWISGTTFATTTRSTYNIRRIA
jgi:hypothetical protein